MHVPKTAGQSIESAFLEFLGETWLHREPYLLFENTNPEIGPPRMAHLTSLEYTTLGHVGANEWERFFKFGFVRNPWTRLVSEYRFRASRIRSPFREWVLEHFPQPGWSDMWRHVMPQSDYLFDSRGRQMVDFIGRFENLLEDYGLLQEHLGVALPKLRKVNATNEIGFMERARTQGLAHGIRGALSRRLAKSRVRRPADWRTYYDNDTNAFVERFYAEDIERFGYSFDS
ncbi:sulfotransferase family 2 domain-containing protein [Wenzhouxiangella sediminis]|uniref:sulfotransferase family 2 domain-containing protein n=1 Tax=Wenzhouxiangella sediminis TaxID=1792836 RepID=UPI0015F29E20|nr:sulfotransferase family 2 domain-containing protein [Wenzhouxiangella sediminis]